MKPGRERERFPCPARRKLTDTRVDRSHRGRTARQSCRCPTQCQLNARLHARSRPRRKQISPLRTVGAPQRPVPPRLTGACRSALTTPTDLHFLRNRRLRLPRTGLRPPLVGRPNRPTPGQGAPSWMRHSRAWPCRQPWRRRSGQMFPTPGLPFTRRNHRTPVTHAPPHGLTAQHRGLSSLRPGRQMALRSCLSMSPPLPLPMTRALLPGRGSCR
jgi:hypothetical protein